MDALCHGFCMDLVDLLIRLHYRNRYRNCTIEYIAWRWDSKMLANTWTNGSFIFNWPDQLYNVKCISRPTADFSFSSPLSLLAPLYFGSQIAASHGDTERLVLQARNNIRWCWFTGKARSQEEFFWSLKDRLRLPFDDSDSNIALQMTKRGINQTCSNTLCWSSFSVSSFWDADAQGSCGDRISYFRVVQLPSDSASRSVAGSFSSHRSLFPWFWWFYQRPCRNQPSLETKDVLQTIPQSFQACMLC